MPPHYELNERFQRYIRRAQRTRRLAATSLAVVCLLVGRGVAVESFAPPNSIAREHLAASLASVSNIPSHTKPQLAAALAPFSNIPTQSRAHLAAASSLPWLDALSARLYRAICPLFSDCEMVATNSATSPQNVNRPFPSKTNSRHATNPANVKSAKQQPPSQFLAPTQNGATATPVAVSTRSACTLHPKFVRWSPPNVCSALKEGRSGVRQVSPLGASY